MILLFLLNSFHFSPAHSDYEQDINKAFETRDRIIGFDCADFDSDHTIISLLHEESCSLHSDNYTTESVHVRVLQKKVYEAKHYIQCLVNYDVTINYCGRMSDTFIKRYTFVDEISHQSCRAIHQTQFYQDPRKDWLKITIINNKGYYNGIVAGSLKGDSCEGTTYVDREGVTHSRVYVHQEIRILINEGTGDINTQDKILILASGVRCDAMKGTCFDPVWGVTFWSMNVPNEYCRKTDSIFTIFEGMVNKTTEVKNNLTKISYYSNDDDRMFFIEAIRPISICNIPGFISQHPDIYITEDVKTSFFFKRDKKFSIKNIDTLILHGFQLSLIYNDLSQQMTKLYETIQYQKCISDSKLIAATLSLAKYDPESLGLSIFGANSGFMTKISGEAAYIVKCKPKSVKIRKTPLCYSEIPVTYNNESYFLTPRSRLLVKVGTQLSCDDFFRPMFYVNKQWFTRHNGNFIQAISPIMMKIEKFHDWKINSLTGIAHKGIYSSEDIQNYKKSINEPLSQKALETNFYQAIKGESDLNPAFKIGNIITVNDIGDVFNVSDWSKRVLASAYESLILLGHHFSAFIALFIILTVLKSIIEWGVSSYLLYKVFGWSWRLIFSCWKSIADAFLYSAKNVNTIMDNASKFNDPEPFAKSAPTVDTYELEQIGFPTAPKAFTDYAKEAPKLNIISN